MKNRIVTGRFQAHEALLLLISVILGANYLLVTIPPPESLQALAPKWLVMLWSLGLLVSGLAGLVAMFWPSVKDVDVALQVERGAMIMSSGTLLLILGSIVVITGLRGAFGIAFILAWIAANLMRALQIQKDLKKLRKLVEGSGADEH